MNDALIKRNQDLTPTPNDITQLTNLMTSVSNCLESLILTPGDFDSCQLEEIKQVGSLKKGTLLLSNKLIGDVCVVLKTLPTKEAVSRLATKVFDDLIKTITDPIESKNYLLNLNERGFEICLTSTNTLSSSDVAVQVMVTTLYFNLRKLDPNLHLDAKQCQLSLSSIKHARWFEENSSHSTIKVLIRLLKDIRSRFDGLSALTPWIIDLLAHYAVMFNPKREPLSLLIAFRRTFQLISAGFFLPGSAGIIDPCEQSVNRVHTTMTLEQQDQVCYTCQTLLRVLAHGGYKQIIGIEGNSSIATTMSMWNSVVVIPASKAFENNKDMMNEFTSSNNEPGTNELNENELDSVNTAATLSQSNKQESQSESVEMQQ